jgi:hypothetical protein
MSLRNFWESKENTVRFIAVKINVRKDKIIIFDNSKEYFRFINIPGYENLDWTDIIKNDIKFSYLDKDKLSGYYSNSSEGEWRLFQYNYSNQVILELRLTTELIFDFGYYIFNIRELIDETDLPFEIRNAAKKHYSKFSEGFIISNYDNYFSKISKICKSKYYSRKYRDYITSKKYSDFGYNEWGTIEFFMSDLLPLGDKSIGYRELLGMAKIKDEYLNSFVHPYSSSLQYQDARGYDGSFGYEHKKSLLIGILKKINQECYVDYEEKFEQRMKGKITTESINIQILAQEVVRNLMDIDDKKFLEYDTNYHKRLIYDKIQTLILDSYPKRILKIGIEVNIHSDSPSGFIFDVLHR